MEQERLMRLLGKCQEILSSLQARCGFPTSDRDDLEQEMALALLQVSDGHTDSYCLSRAAWAALKWLRRAYHAEAAIRVDPLPNIAELIERGTCRRIWA